MSTKEIHGRNYAWERVRYLSRTLADHSVRRRRYSFEPGDIACCYGSIERVFCHHLKDLNIPLEPWEGEKPFKQPLRFCVINRRFEGGVYEVFLMTTFGQARTFDQLGPIARNYGIPVGGMKWFENIDPIQTYPPTFGYKGKSFIFGISTFTEEVIPTAAPSMVRLVPGELERLRKIAGKKMMNTYRVHRDIRRSLKNRRYGTSSSVDDEQDDFLPSEEEDATETKHDDFQLTMPFSPKHAPKLGRRPLPIRHDLFWLLNNASHRIFNYSTYLDRRGIHRKGPVQLRLQATEGCVIQQQTPPLPKPYVSPHLRINIKAISRILR